LATNFTEQKKEGKSWIKQ